MVEHEEATTEEVVLQKAPYIAYCSLKKLHCTPFIQPDGRVAFKVLGDVAGTLVELASNPKVPLLDYLNRLDAVRSTIFAMKGQGNGKSAA